MKILHTVQSYYPSTGGMQEVVRQLSERLVKKGHEVTVATEFHSQRTKTILKGVKIISFKISGNMVYGYQGKTEEIIRYQNFLLKSDFDIVTNFAAQQWATDVALPILNRIKAKKVFVPEGFSGLYIPEYKLYFKKMKIWMRRYDMNVFHSNDYRDINFAKKNNINKIKLIPNGASEEEFLGQNNIDIKEKLNIPKNHFLILNVGSHTGTKGHEEAIEIFKKAKLSNSTLLIVGNSFKNGCKNKCFIQEKFFNFSPKRHVDKKKLIIKSLTRKETITAYKQADLFLFPSNAECSPLVLYESMASKTPFLVTDVGSSKEIINWSNSGLLLPTIFNQQGDSKAKINESVKILENICLNSNQRKKMAENGFDAWKKSFTWEKISKKYEALYFSLIKN